MKKQILFKSALSLVAAAAAGSAMAVSEFSDDFESYSTGSFEGNAITAKGWDKPEGDTSTIIDDGTGSNQVLKLNTEGTDLKNVFDSGVAEALDTAATTNGAYFSAKVKFVASDDIVSGIPAFEDSTKFAVYAYANPVTETNNLVIVHGYLDSNGDPAVTNEVFTGITIDPEQFYTLNFKVFNDTDNTGYMLFTASFDGDPLETAVTDDITREKGATYMLALCKDDSLGFSEIAFKGTGEVDDIDVGSVEAAPTQITVTLKDGGFTATNLTVNGVAVPIAATIDVDEGAIVEFTVANGDGATKTMMITASASVDEIDFTGATFGWADYLGAAVDGAYEIDNLAELKLFQKGIPSSTNEVKLATAGETFKLTADIALDAAWPGIGVQNGKDIYSTADFNAAAFQGTFDGQNHTISGFQMIGKGTNPEGLDYCGFFNSTYGATIQNLKIAYAGSLFAADTTADTHESGATFVGVAKNSTLRNLTTVAGTVSCSKGFGGIVGFLTSGTSVESCTNNVNMTSLANNKCGGIAMIAQGGSAVSISNCVNNGTQTTSSKNEEYGAIVGYVGLDITIADCETTVGRFLKHQGNTVTLQGVNKGDATVLAYHGAATPGLNFATVVGNVATFVADNALAAENTYKVMGPSATATYEFAAAGTIAFDTALATPTYAITAASGFKVLEPVTADGVTTYTAEADTPAGTELEPDEQAATVYTTQADAEAATNNVTIVASSTVEAALDSTELAAYTAMFEAKVVEVTGGYAIKVGLTEAAATALEDQATDDAAEVIEDLSESTVTLTTTPGFYYSFEYGTSLGSMAEVGTRTLATGDSLTLTRPTTAGATSGFYKVLVNVTAE